MGEQELVFAPHVAAQRESEREGGGKQNHVAVAR